MPTFKNLNQFGWILRTGQYIEQGGQVEVSEDDAQLLARSPYLALVEEPAEQPAPEEAHPTPDELRAEAERLMAEAAQEESK